jgi:hypothetical protein
MSTEELSRKKQTRGAYRASATRIIPQISENLDAPKGANSSKLRQQRSLLLAKVSVLGELNNTISLKRNWKKLRKQTN